MKAVVYSPQPTPAGQQLKSVLIRDGGTVFWSYVGDLDRESAIQLVFEAGVRALVCDGDPDDHLPQWFMGVDLVALRRDTESLLAEGGERREWYAAPLLKPNPWEDPK